MLDRTHLRFFTRESVDALLAEAGLGLTEIFFQQLEIGASEVTFNPRLVPAGVIQAIERDPDARTYQFVVKAVLSNAVEPHAERLGRCRRSPKTTPNSVTRSRVPRHSCAT